MAGNAFRDRDEAGPRLIPIHSEFSDADIPSAGLSVREQDAVLPLIGLGWLDDVLVESVARDRLNAVVSGTFAFAGMLLAMAGLYGLLAFSVTERPGKSAFAWRWAPAPRPCWR